MLLAILLVLLELRFGILVRLDWAAFILVRLVVAIVMF